jgi:hypothetical protein
VRSVLVLVGLAAVLGCAPTVGPRAGCDELAAHAIVYRLDGRPAYVGQALLVQTCGAEAGACHSSDATGAARYGTPFGLDFDVVPLRDDGVEELARLANAQATAHRHRNRIWASVLDGTMPPGPEGARHVASAYYVDITEDAEVPMPGLETAEAREALRNWLACGAPIIERFAPPRMPRHCERDEDCPVSAVCDRSVEECAGVGDMVAALDVRYEADFPSIYDRILRPSCADVEAGCHGEAPRAELDLSSMDAALTALTSATAPTDPATGALCSPTSPAAATRCPSASRSPKPRPTPSPTGSTPSTTLPDPHPNNSGTTRPATSVSRKSRPSAR